MSILWTKKFKKVKLVLCIRYKPSNHEFGKQDIYNKKGA